MRPSGVGHWADGRGRLSWPPTPTPVQPAPQQGQPSPARPDHRHRELASLFPQPFPLKDEAPPGHPPHPQIMGCPWGARGPGQASLEPRHLPSPGEALPRLLRSPWQVWVAPDPYPGGTAAVAGLSGGAASGQLGSGTAFPFSTPPPPHTGGRCAYTGHLWGESWPAGGSLGPVTPTGVPGTWVWLDLGLQEGPHRCCSPPHGVPVSFTVEWGEW